MSSESVQAWLAHHAPDLHVVTQSQSTATVALAAEAFGVAPGQIAKTLSFRVNDDVILLVMAGDARLDNKKYKEQFGVKARMLGSEEVEALTGHPVGGVCPFATPAAATLYCDASLQAWDEVIPAGGSANTGVRIASDRLATLVGAQWVNVAREPVVAE